MLAKPGYISISTYEQRELSVPTPVLRVEVEVLEAQFGWQAGRLEEGVEVEVEVCLLLQKYCTAGLVMDVTESRRALLRYHR